MLACAIGDCNIDVFIRVVEATGKGNYFKVLYIILMDLPNGDLVAAGAIYCAVKRAVCSMALSMKAGLCDIECYKTNNIEKVQVANDQENEQSERNFHSESRGGKTKLTIRYL